MSYHHFVNLDVIVFGPPFRLVLHCDARVNVNVDCHLSASVLAAVGAVCRLNRFSIDAGHYAAAGGAGSRDARLKSDLRACRWLQRRWGAGAFRMHSQRQAQVIFRGCQLVERASVRLPALHRELQAAMVPTKSSGIRDSAAVMAAVGALDGLKPVLPTFQFQF